MSETLDLTPELLERLRSLPHVSNKLPHDGLVFVLNTGALIGPESEAMLQALHSRSIGGILSHLKVLAEKGPKKFMSTFYVGYGHKSIGDCGSATVFIEGVSMLVAKAIQDSPLYCGQESSTRYIDFSNQRFADPFGTEQSRTLLEHWRTFYLKGLDEMKRVLPKRFPKPDSEKEDVYAKAVNARAFDIMRGFLPAGATTNLAWHTTLRQFADRLNLLRHHPLDEVRTVALAIEDALMNAFPNSFSNKRYSESESYYELAMDAGLYLHEDNSYCSEFTMSWNALNGRLLEGCRPLFTNRPPKTELPKYLDECGLVRFEFLLDFGSFRDIHRQRSITQRMPLVTTKYGFGSWYLEQLPTALREEAEQLLAEQKSEITNLPGMSEARPKKQYYVAMGYNLPNCVTGGLPGLVYTAELRSQGTVHPTLRHRAQQMGAKLKQLVGPYGLTVHMDESPDRFSLKRGTHDIVHTS